MSVEIERRKKLFALARLLGVGGALLLVVLSPGLSPAAAQPAVDWPTITFTQVFGGLNGPVHLTNAGDGSGRMFIVEKAGRIMIAEGGVISPTPFLDIEGRVGSGGSEQGLLSVVFPPGYEVKGYFYVNYTDVNGDTVVARYHVTADPDVADPASEEIILTVDQPYANHNGGQLAFGPDGYLYIGMGDGGSAGDPEEYAQDPSSLLGKLLRIDVEFGGVVTEPITTTHSVYLPLIQGGTEITLPYRIPPGNPYTQTAGYRDEIWALGLRNPWRFSFDPATGDLYIGDVGQGSWEEIDFQPASSSGGENYGWDIMEGAHCYEDPNCDPTGLVLPVAEYSHSLGCSVTGGWVYRGPNAPGMQGIYFYADYCSGRVWGLAYDGGWQHQELADTGFSITSFGVDEVGYLYVLDYWSGDVYRVDEVASR
jgi:glucose/arabinose dehydrogenase